MLKLIDNMSIKTKLFVFTALILICIIIVAVFSLYNEYRDGQKQLQLIEGTIYNNYDLNIKSQVENVVTLLDGVYQKYESGELTLEESKKLGADLVRNLRYGDEGYFWIDTIQGDNVVLLGSDVEGTNRYDFHDAKGKPILKVFIEMALQAGEGYQTYWFPRANQSEPLMKRGYVKLFEPFQWVVGTGNYINDINEVVTDKRRDAHNSFIGKIYTLCILFLFIIFCTIFVVFLVSRSITRPLGKTINLANLIAEGVLDVELEMQVTKRKDEIGQLAVSVEKMKQAIKELIDRLTEKAAMLELEKDLFSTTLKSIGDGVISTDRDGRIVLVNSVSEELTGWKQEESNGRPFEEVFKIVDEKTGEKCESPVGRAMKDRKVVLLENHTILITKTGRKIPIEDSAAPILDKNGEITGTVLVFRDATEKKERQQRIEYLSYHDQLTGLYNRHFFEEEVKRLDVDRNIPFSIAMVDVNGLKLTNDAFGHEAGDLLLKSVAQALKSECRTDDIISRVGGDEFVLLLPKTNAAEAEAIVKRIYKVIGQQKMNNIILSVSIGWETKNNPQDDIKDIYSKAEDYMYRRKITESQSMRNQTIKVIMRTLHEANSREKLHAEQVSRICRVIGEAMNLEEEVLKELEITGLMHDIGKIAIDSSILDKPEKLTEAEYEEIKRHPEISYHILKSADVYTRLAEYVLSHHERWDGNGYPRGLRGEEIPLVARIITVADAYEAMTASRPYKESLSHEKAMEELQRCAGTQFDSRIVEAYEKSCREMKNAE